MQRLHTLLFVYCALFAVVLMISGLTSVHSLPSITAQLLFLPITGHFIYEIYMRIKHKKSIHGKHSKNQSIGKSVFLITIGGVFSLLLIISILKINNKSANDRISPLSQSMTNVNEQMKKEVASPSAQPVRTLIIVAEDEQTPVNMYEKASALSKLVHKAANDDSFTIVSLKNKWYEVILENGKKAFVHEEFTKESK